MSALASGMLHLTLDTSTATAAEVQGLLDGVASNSSSSGDADSVRALLAHARLLLQELLPATDRALKSLRAVREDQDQQAVRSVVLKRQMLSRTTARQYRLPPVRGFLAADRGLVHLGLRLRSRARALQRRAAFEHVIAGVSMRFINTRPQELDTAIEQALAAMGKCVGADRVYFLLARPRLRSHSWHRTETVRRPGWPDGALALPTLCSVRRRMGSFTLHAWKSLPPGNARDAVSPLVCKARACVVNVGADGVSAMLGFDALHQRCRITRPGELSLLRMALDAILYAVQRRSMELERARLETRLQQSRRMETVGALASGIAHNFNNIVGAILGFAEMAEAQVQARQPARA